MGQNLAVEKLSSAALAALEAADRADAPLIVKDAPVVELITPLGLPISAETAARMQADEAPVGETVKPGDVARTTAAHPEIVAAAKRIIEKGELGTATELPARKLERVLVHDRRPVDGPLVEAFVLPGILESMPPQRAFYLKLTPSGFHLPGHEVPPRVYGPFHAVVRP
jgi:hypothetical protein